MMIALAVAVSVGAFSGTFFARGEQRPAPAPLNVGYISDPISEFRTDVDGDGLFDALVLRIPFVVNESGHFSLQAWMTANGASAANFTNLVLSAGTHVVDLVLPGWRIRLTQTDGPYAVEIFMYNADTGNSTDRQYQTAAYDWTTFEFLAELQGGLADRAIDPDGDGLYNYLEVRGVLNVTKAQDYDLRADLFSQGGTWSYAYALNHTYWAAGTWLFVLRFSGDQIQKSGVDGPYRVEVRLGGEYSDWWQTESFVTGAYSASQFYHQPVVFRGNLTDQGVDLDGNGLFDVIRIGIPITVTVSGAYRVSGTLTNFRGESFSVFRDLTLSLSDVNMTLDFDAFTLKGSLLDSAYSLDLYVFEFASAYYIHATHSTGVYRWSELDNPYANWVPDLRVETIDDNGDGLLDELRLNATFLAKRAATFSVWFNGDFTYCGYNCHVENTISVTGGPGLVSVETSFPGWRVRVAGSNGTYRFFATLFAESYLLESETAEANFTYDQFSRALALRGPILYRTVDNDGDGLVNQLVAIVPLRNFQSGPYTFTAAAYNASSYSAVFSTRQRYLEPGDIDVEFPLSGLLVRQLGANVSFYLSATLPWGFSTFTVLEIRIPPMEVDPSIFQTAIMKDVTFSSNPPPANVCCGFLRLVNYSNALVLDIRLDSRGQATAAIPDVSYVGVAAVPGSPAFYSWTGRVPAPLPGNVILNVTRTRPHTDDFLDVTITNWSSGRAWLNRTLASDPFTRFNADLTYDADGMLTSEEIRNAFKFLWPGIVLGVILQADNYSVPVSRAGPDEGVGVGPVETGDPITLAMPGSLALPEVESSSHTLVVNLTGGNPYYTPSARVRVPLGWNITNVATASGVVVSGVGTREVLIGVTENRTFPSDAVLTVHPTTPAAPRGQISGRILGGGGMPLPGAHATAVRDGVEVSNVTTGSDGVFTCTGLAGGTYEIRVWADGYASRTLTVSLAEAERLGLGDIPLTASSAGSGVVVGRIRDDSGAAITDVSVDLIHDGIATAQTHSTADGSFQFDSVAAGSYTLRVTATGFVTRELPIEVVAGTTSNLGEIVLSRSSVENSLGLWIIPAVAGIVIVGIAAAVVWTWKIRSRVKPPEHP